MITTPSFLHLVPGKPPAPRRAARRRARGTILIVTVWIVLVLAALVLVLARTMRVEAVCSSNGVSAMEAQAVEQGAVQYVLSHVDSLGGQAQSDANAAGQMIRVGDGAFWIIRPNFDDDRACAFGIVDEGSKVNLNTTPLSMLSRLPDMTDELAVAIIDWRTSDANSSSGGGKNEYYLLLPNPYQCKSAPLETVEELLLVRGATPEILFGEDTNRNGVLDVNEDDSDASEPADNHDGQLDRGLLPYVTVYSASRNIGPDGNSRINVNDRNQTAALAGLLQKHMTPERADAVLGAARRGRPFRNTLDFHVRTGLTVEEFTTLANNITTSAGRVVKGLINVNTAPPAVLACLPGLDDGDVSSIVARRTQADVDTSSLAWVAQTLSRSKLAAIGSYVSTQSCRFSADIVSLAGDGRAFKRCYIVVDAQTSPPRLIYRRDLTHLGWPLDERIIAQVRSGISLDALASRSTTVMEAPR